MNTLYRELKASVWENYYTQNDVGGQKEVE